MLEMMRDGVDLGVSAIRAVIFAPEQVHYDCIYSVVTSHIDNFPGIWHNSVPVQSALYTLGTILRT